MPNYDYICSECGHQFEYFQKMSDDPLKICPKCHGSVKRLIGAGAGLIFKGSGFYITDYKKSSISPSNDPVKSEKSKPEKKAETSVKETKGE